MRLLRHIFFYMRYYVSLSSLSHIDSQNGTAKSDRVEGGSWYTRNYIRNKRVQRFISDFLLRDTSSVRATPRYVKINGVQLKVTLIQAWARARYSVVEKSEYRYDILTMQLPVYALTYMRAPRKRPDCRQAFPFSVARREWNTRRETCTYGLWMVSRQVNDVIRNSVIGMPGTSGDDIRRESSPKWALSLIPRMRPRILFSWLKEIKTLNIFTWETQVTTLYQFNISYWRIHWCEHISVH